MKAKGDKAAGTGKGRCRPHEVVRYRFGSRLGQGPGQAVARLRHGRPRKRVALLRRDTSRNSKGPNSKNPGKGPRAVL